MFSLHVTAFPFFSFFPLSLFLPPFFLPAPFLPFLIIPSHFISLPPFPLHPLIIPFFSLPLSELSHSLFFFLLLKSPHSSSFPSSSFSPLTSSFSSLFLPPPYSPSFPYPSFSFPLSPIPPFFHFLLFTLPHSLLSPLSLSLTTSLFSTKAREAQSRANYCITRVNSMVITTDSDFQRLNEIKALLEVTNKSIITNHKT